MTQMAHQQHSATGALAGLRIGCMASILLATGILLGAFGSHGLKAFATPKGLELWQIATHYLLIHALGLLIISGLINLKWCNTRPAFCLIAGIGMFCGTLYGMALKLPTTWFVVITPIGGTLLAIGWGWLALQLYHTYRQLSKPSKLL